MFGFLKKAFKNSPFQDNYDFLAINYPKDLKLKVAKALQNDVNAIVKNRENIEEVRRFLTIAIHQKNEAVSEGIASKENPNWLIAELKCNLCELIISGERLPTQSAINAMNILFGWIDFAERK